MFCPLCKAEFREGITNCSDCHLSLVSTREEAASTSVELWSGEDQQRLDKLLASLDAAQIPSHFKERISSSLPVRLSYSIVPVRPRFEFAVWVLRHDAPRAEEVFRQIELAEQAEGDAEDGGENNVG